MTDTKYNVPALPCSSWGRFGFLVGDGKRDDRFKWSAKRRAQCAACLSKTACAQDAADSPVALTGVWGGLLLPEEASLLPSPTVAEQYAPHPKGSPVPWHVDSRRSLDPDTRQRVKKKAHVCKVPPGYECVAGSLYNDEVRVPRPPCPDQRCPHRKKL